MLRRDFVRAALTIGIAPRLLLAQQQGTTAPPPPAPVPWTLGLNPLTPLPQVEVAEDIATSELRFFTPLQMQSLSRLASVLVPPIGEKPGALQAEVPAFLDFLIGNSPDVRKQLYSSGLDWLESQAQKNHNTAFASLDEAQAGELITPWLRTWMSDHPPTEAHADFINIARDEIRTATVNSRAWFDATSHPSEPDPFDSSLYWYPIQPDLEHESSDCSRVPPHVQAVPKPDHPIPSYPR